MPSSTLPRITTARLALTHARPGNEARTVAFFDRNREHFRRWDPPVSADFYTEEFWHRALTRSVDDFAADRGVRFDMVRAGDEEGPLIGRLGFSQVVRGPLQSCVLGYQIDHAYEGRGLMYEALAAAIDYMFGVRHLHRIQAGYRPENARSGRVLTRLGFETEGLSRNFLFIDGHWCDHVMTALINPNFVVTDSAALTRQG